jgi:hypothetical protein
METKNTEVTIERLERGLAICAYLMVRDGPIVAPLFERMESDLAAMRQTQDTVERAKRLLESYSGVVTRCALRAADRQVGGPPRVPVVQREDGFFAIGWHDDAPGPFETRAFAVARELAR